MSVHSNDNAGRWQGAPSVEIAWVTWGNDHIAYHRPSGCTHFLNIASRQLITEILQEPKDVEGVLVEFGLSESDSDWTARRDEMQSMLEQLERLGFVDRL